MHYFGEGAARAALVTAADRRFSSVTGERTVLCADVEPYRPGEFYRRELGPVLAVCAGADPLAALVIDGYVDLDPLGRPGLGRYVHAELGIPVLGVAKNAFLTASHAATVRRGQSRRFLYVTSVGMEVSDTAAMIRDMAGTYRMPDALRRVDRLARSLDQPVSG